MQLTISDEKYKMVEALAIAYNLTPDEVVNIALDSKLKSGFTAYCYIDYNSFFLPQDCFEKLFDIKDNSGSGAFYVNSGTITFCKRSYSSIEEIYRLLNDLITLAKSHNVILRGEVTIPYVSNIVIENNQIIFN